MRTRKFILAGLAILGSVSVAAAQTSPPVPDKAVDASAEPAGIGGSKVPAGPSARAIRPAAVALGWNTLHAYSCVMSQSGSVYTLRMNSLPSEGPWIQSTRLPFHGTMAAQCATGNWVSFYVTKISGTSFTWTNFQAWSYK